MLLALASVALAKPLDPAELSAFLSWRCSADNPLRYDGDVPLAPLPAGMASEAWDRDMDGGPPAVFAITPSGAQGDPSARWIAVDPATPMSNVTSALDLVASRLDPRESRWLLFAVPEPRASRPPPPLRGKELADYEAWDGADPLAPLPTGCEALQAAPPMPCSAAVPVVAQALADPRCRGVAPEWLAWFDQAASESEGVPVALVRVRAAGPAPIGGEGAWGEAAPRWVGLEDLAMRPPSASPLVQDVPVAGPGAMRTTKCVVPRYPIPAGIQGSVDCLATVWIDERGVPFDVQVGGCPAEYHPAVRAALLQWRWTPPKVDGEPSKVRSDIAVTFGVR